jgi:hypothetical protein
MHALTPELLTSGVDIVFYKPSSGWIDLKFPGTCKMHAIRPGNIFEIQNKILELVQVGHDDLGSIWNILYDLDLSRKDKVIILGQSVIPIPPTWTIATCIIRIGEIEDSLDIQDMQQLCASTGGFYFPSITEVMGILEVMNCIVKNFVNVTDETLDERRQSSSPPKPISTTPFDDFCLVHARTSSIDRLRPCSRYLKALYLDSSSIANRWTRGLRMIREKCRKVRDIVFEDPGPLGLELNPPTGTETVWRVLRSHPPASGLGLKINSIVIAVNGVAVDADTDKMDLVRLMARRPLIVSIASAEKTIAEGDPNRFEYIQSICEEISVHALTKRAQSPFKTVPKPFPKDTREALPFDCKLSDLLAVADIVTPAAFVHVPNTVKNLRIEGFPLEYAFIQLVLASFMSGTCQRDDRLWWIRVFLILLERIDPHSSNLLEEAIQLLCGDIKITPETIEKAGKIGLDEIWVREWLQQEENA